MNKYRELPFDQTTIKQHEKFPIKIDDRRKECYFCKHKGDLHIHHKDGNHDNNKKINLIWLCPVCHAKIHKSNITIE